MNDDYLLLGTEGGRDQRNHFLEGSETKCIRRGSDPTPAKGSFR